MPFSLPHANPMEQSPNQLPQKLPILNYTRQREIEILSGVIYIHQPMLPAKCYCFTVTKTKAAISLERVKNAYACVYKMHGVGSVGAVFTAESLIEHCQVVRSVNSSCHGEKFAFVRRCCVRINYANI